MTNPDQIKGEYHKVIQHLLSDQPDIFQKFEEFWRVGEYRKASLIANDAIRELQLKLSPEQMKVDEDFYWVFVN
jgi:hypothetical protein